MVSTARLVITPLAYPQLLMYLQANDHFEEETGLLKNGRTMNKEVRNRVEKFTLPFIKAAAYHNYLFYTFWIVVDTTCNCIVAELGFKGSPNARGEIEIGYGTMPAWQGKGYMTEAVGAMLRWAALQPDVQAMLAETDQHNQASIRVVQKNGFEQFDRKGQMLWWRKGVAAQQGLSLLQ